MRVITLGEIMLRLTPPGYNRFVQSAAFEAHYGGAEANVAAALAGWGESAAFVSKVPAHEIGQAAVNALRRWGVDTRFVLRGGGRLGVYYAECGVDRRAGKVLYDRAHSAFADSSPEEYDWRSVFTGADWFHFTGITPALGKPAEEIVAAACKAAKALGLTVSCDVNYRSKLWDKERAAAVLERLFADTDVCIVNESQAAELFGVSGEEALPALAQRYSFTHVAFTFRRTQDARHNRIWSMLWSGGECVRSCEYAMEMVDRIGGGDAFAAGLIYAIGHGFALRQAADFAEAASCLKHSVPGDICLCSLEEVEALAANRSAGSLCR